MQLYKSANQYLKRFHQHSEEQLILKPGPAIWSVHEILEHILLFNKMYYKMIQRSIENSNPPSGVSDSFKARFFIRPFIKLVKPPYKIKIKTLSPMRPAGIINIPTHSLLDELLEFNEDMIQFVEQLAIQKLDLDRIKGHNKVFKIKMTLTEFLLMMAAHQDRHIWQADQTLDKLSAH